MLQVMSVAEESVVIPFVELVPVLVCVLIVVCCRAQDVLALGSHYSISLQPGQYPERFEGLPISLSGSCSPGQV